MSTISMKQALYYGINELKKTGINSARLDSEILLSFILNIPREKLISSSNLQITTHNLNKFKKLVSKRLKHYPIAYIVGHKEFYGIDFFVNENVLIPRPETELLVDEILEYATSPAALRLPPSPIIRRGTPDEVRRGEVNILEIGTGSGCIALALAKYLPQAKITATDVSEKVLKVARKNRKKLKIKNVKFKKSDLLSNIKTLPNIIVANLPYLTENELKEVSISKEPRLALYGGKDGVNIYEKLLKQIKQKLIDNGSQLTLFVEIGDTQSKLLKKIILDLFPKAEMEIKKDLAGKDRVMILKIKKSGN